jgi:hypothetical protein
MKYLLVKEKGKRKYTLYSTATFGIDTWGSTTQEYLVKKKKYWYIHQWSAGNDWVEDQEYEYKLNVVQETADLDSIISYLAKYNEKEIEHIYKDARKIYNEYLDMMEAFYKNY